MPADTPRGLPYPLPTEPVAEGAQAIRNLAEQVDLRVIPFGAPIPWVAATIPTGYIEFDGRTLTAGTYPKLFALYGATLPDLRGRFLLGAYAAKPVGTVGGAETHTLAVLEMPAHAHAVTDPGHGLPNNFLAQTGGGGTVGGGGTATFTNGAGQFTGISIQNNGGSQAHNNMPPFRSVTWITPSG